MKPTDLFAVALKVVGIVFVISGLSGLPSTVAYFNSFPTDELQGLPLILRVAGWQIVYVFCGFFIAIKTSWFVDLVYPKDLPDDDEDEPDILPSSDSATD